MTRALHLARWACSILAALARDLRDASREIGTCPDCGAPEGRDGCDCSEGC